MDDIREMVYGSSSTDMLVAMPLPLTDLFKDGLSPWMDGAAANFPDLSFVIFHVGLPFIDEVCWQLIPHPNLYASIAATINFIVWAPRQFAETKLRA